MHQIVESDVGTKNVRNNFYRFQKEKTESNQYEKRPRQ